MVITLGEFIRTSSIVSQFILAGFLIPRAIRRKNDAERKVLLLIGIGLIISGLVMIPDVLGNPLENYILPDSAFQLYVVSLICSTAFIPESNKFERIFFQSLSTMWLIIALLLRISNNDLWEFMFGIGVVFIPLSVFFLFSMRIDFKKRKIKNDFPMLTFRSSLAKLLTIIGIFIAFSVPITAFLLTNVLQENRFVIQDSGILIAIVFIVVAIFNETSSRDQLVTNEIRKLSRAVEQSPIIIIITDLEGNILFKNHIFSNKIEQQFNEIVKENGFKINNAFDVFLKYSDLNIVLETSTEYHDEIFLKGDNNNSIWFSISISHIKNDRGVPTNFLIILDEITEQKNAQIKQELLLHKLQSANEDLKNFALILSHDLKAPIRSVSALSSWLLSDYKDKLDEKGKEMITLLNERGKRMQSLIDGILEYSTVGFMKRKKTQINLQKIMEDVLILLDIPSTIELIIRKNLPIVLFEETHAKQVFQNLLTNAIKSVDKQNGKIQIDWDETKDEYKFFFSDNGKGIDKKDFIKIFKLFQTIEPFNAYEGTGIGLALVKKIIESYEGKIWVKSEIGEGSTFIFTIPK